MFMLPRSTAPPRQSPVGGYVAISIALLVMTVPIHGRVQVASQSLQRTGAPRPQVHVSVQTVHVARNGQWIATRAWIRNPSAHWWTPAAHVRFSARDDRGHVVATYVARAALRPARTVSVIAPSFLLPTSMRSMPRVAVGVWVPTWERTATYARPRIHLARVRVIRSHDRPVVVGVARNSSREGVVAVVGCTGRDRHLHLTGAALGRVIVSSGGRTEVRVALPHAVPGTVAGNCRVMGWNRT